MKKLLHEGKRPRIAAAKTKRVTIALPQDKADNDSELSSALDKSSGKE
jgi:hypothetical protein